MIKKFLRSIFGGQTKVSQEQPPTINASFYDLERSDDSIDNHLRHATLSAADIHASHSVREMIRKKVRYEYANSSLLKGIVLTRANSVVGKGPQCILPADGNRMSINRSRNPAALLRRQRKAKEIAASISKKINKWILKVDLGGKLRQMVKAKLIDGESFLAFVPDGDSIHPRVFDCDRVCDHWIYNRDDEDWVDGVKYNPRTGEATDYRISKTHPAGDYLKAGHRALTGNDRDRFFTFSRSFVFHFFRKDFGEQHRGVSELMPSLDIAAILRRSRKSVALANETAANMSLILQSKLDADEEAAVLPEAWTQVPVVQNTMTVVPNGLEMAQMKSEHPNSQWEKFREACVADIARTLDMPLNRAIGSSADYNFSSAMMDGLHDMLSCDIERDIIRRECLDKAFRLLIAYMVGTGFFSILEEMYLFAGGELPTPIWHFATDGNEVDPQKQMKGKELAIRLGLSSITSMVAERGEDIDDHDAVLAKENGMTVEEFREMRARANFAVTGELPGDETNETDNTDS